MLLFFFADVIDCVVVHFQETKQGSVKEALERGSRYLDTLGMGSSLGQKLKAAAKKEGGINNQSCQDKEPYEG